MSALVTAAQQALEALERIDQADNDCGFLNPSQFYQLNAAMTALRTALAEQCKCKDRPAAECPGEWEPGCDLGANEEHAALAEPDDDSLTAAYMAGLYDAKKAEPQGEPVAKTGKAYADSLIDALLLPLAAMTASDLEALHRRCAEMLLMYAAPEAPQPRREPLTDEEIDALELPPSGTATVRDLVRLIEAAHGITGETK